MNGLARFTTALVGLALAVVLPAAGHELTHRVWLGSGVPEPAVMESLHGAGVASFALVVGRVQLGDNESRLSIIAGDFKGLSGYPTHPVVWVDGAGDAAGDAESFVVQLDPVLRSVPNRAGLVLAARRFEPGIARFAMDVAKRVGGNVELVLPARDLAANVPAGGWQGVHLVAVAGGHPVALGFAASTLQDDAAAVDDIDAAGVRYRVAVVIKPRVDPPPGPAGGDLANVCFGEAATYRPGAWGDVFELRRAIDWGGKRLEAGQSIELSFLDIARYHRELGVLMRPVRAGLDGWDTLELPAPDPTVGITRRGFVDYLTGGPARPSPIVEVEWPSSASLRITLNNASSQTSAIGRMANWVEIEFSGTEARDVRLGAFTGTQYGRYLGATFRQTAVREANIVRFYAIYIPANRRITDGVIEFLSRPRDMRTRWGVRLTDGTDLVGPYRTIDIKTP
jgi:hypothetical protein